MGGDKLSARIKSDDDDDVRSSVGTTTTPTTTHTAAVVVFSGGIDSVCVASMLNQRYDDVYGVTFVYGQKANREVRCAKTLAKKLNLKQHRIVDISFMKQLYGNSNVLTGVAHKKMPGKFEYSIVVPIRNAIFLSIATAWAFSIDASCVAYGAHTGDTHYPDCRPPFTRKLESALNAGESDGIKSGLRKKIEIWSPYIAGLTKNDLIKYGLDVLGDTIYETWSCYENQKLQCGVCESCMNRKRSFVGAGIVDKTKYMN